MIQLRMTIQTWHSGSIGKLILAYNIVDDDQTPIFELVETTLLTLRVIKEEFGDFQALQNHRKVLI